MVVLSLKAVENKTKELLIILDNARQHKKKMKAIVTEKLKEQGLQDKIVVRFLHTPPYSPQMNLAEYNIQLIRKKYLKHIPCKMTIDERNEHLIKNIERKNVMNKKQINKIIKRIKTVPFL